MSTIKKIGNWHVLEHDRAVVGRNILHMDLVDFVWQTKKLPEQRFRGADILSYIRAHKRLTTATNSLYVDVGAAYGFTSVPLANIFTNIMAFEPMPDTYKCLQLNCEPYLNIQTFNVALSNRESIQQAYFRPTNTMISSMKDQVDDRIAHRPDHPLFHEINVNTITLDQVVKRPVNLLKIDVEGHEAKVIEGAKKVLSISDAIVIIEQLDPNDTTIKQMMDELHYSHVDTVFSNDYVYKKRR